MNYHIELYTTSVMMPTNKAIEILGDDAAYVLEHTCNSNDKATLHLPANTYVDDREDSATTAVRNKREGGMGLILGRKAFQRPFSEGVALINAVQDVYLDDTITIA